MHAAKILRNKYLHMQYSIYREDFVIEPLAQVRSGFLLLDKACSGILQKRANMSDARETGGMLSTAFIYPAMFWSKITLNS